jgi:hypothetical protein
LIAASHLAVIKEYYIPSPSNSARIQRGNSGHLENKVSGYGGLLFRVCP